MGYVLTKILGVLLTPGAILFLGATLGVALLWTRAWRHGRALLSLILVLIGIIAFSPLGEIALARLEDRFPANPALPERIDGIVILGGAVDQYRSQARQQPAVNDAGERILQGAMLARAHPEAKVVLSGGAADPLRPEPKEAPVMAELLERLGVEKERLIVEDQSRNTFENAVFSQRLAQPGRGTSWVLVTSARHMPRSVGCFRAAGWTVIPFPVDFDTDGGRQWVNGDPLQKGFTHLGRALKEWIGLAFYRVAGWSDALFPGP